MKNLSRFIFIIFFLVLSTLPFMSLAADDRDSPSVGNIETGQASFYSDNLQGRTTASGEQFNQAASTAAHKRLPFGTRVKVTNVDNGKSVTVRINDRGPFVSGRIIDLSRSAFSRIATVNDGVIDVKLELVE